MKPLLFGLQDDIKKISQVNFLALIIICLYNILYGVFIDNINFFIICSTLFYLIISVMIFIFKNDIVNYIIYLIIGSLTLIFAERSIEYSGLIFFIFSVCICKGIKFYIISFSLSFISLSVRLTLLKTPTPISIQMVLLLIFISYSTYIIFLKNNPKKLDGLKKNNKEILELYLEGCSYDDIIKILKLNIQPESVRKIITKNRLESGCKNDVQFGKWLYEKG